MFFTDSYQALRRGERLLALRHAMLSVLVLILVGLPLVYFVSRRFEQSVTFHPERDPLNGEWKPPAGVVDVWFKVADGTRLHGWFVRSAQRPPAATVIFLHGNGGNVSYLSWTGESLADKGFDVLLFDYRGYGRSEGSVSDERGIYEDADAAYDYVSKERGVAPEKIVLYGQSLGTAAAVDVAARKACGAVILESGLSSAADMAATIMPWLPGFVRNLTKNRFDSVGKLPHVRCPVLVAHGDRDGTIPVEQGRKLYAAAPEPKRLVIVNGAGHNDLSITGGEPYTRDLAAFIRESVRAEP